MEWNGGFIIFSALTRLAFLVTRRDAPRLIRALTASILYRGYSEYYYGVQHVCEYTDHYGVLVGQCLECHVPYRINQGHPTRGIFYTVL